MKILYVRGDEYAALDFEKHIGVENAYQRIISENTNVVTYETDDYEIGVTLFEFGEVDRDFVTFIVNKMLDYDQMKHKNFYIVETEESHD